jgi:hypothetical protein
LETGGKDMDGQKITFQELKSEVIEKSKYRHSYLRLGQFVFNYIHGFYGVAVSVKDKDGIDCYYRDDLIDDFLKCCVKRINNNEGYISRRI